MFALVLPREEFALPYVRVALTTLELRDVFLKGVAVSGLVCGGGVTSCASRQQGSARPHDASCA